MSGHNDEVNTPGSLAVLEPAIGRRSQLQAIAAVQFMDLGALNEMQSSLQHPDLLMDEGKCAGWVRD